MKKLIEELKELQLEGVTGFSNDYLISNTFRIGKVFHKYNKSEMLKDVKTLKNFILKNGFNLFGDRDHIYDSIELFDHNNGYVLGVYQAEIGQKYLFYMPKKEILKLYQEAKENLKKKNKRKLICQDSKLKFY